MLPQLLLDAAQGERPTDTLHINRAIAILRELNEGDQKIGVRLLDVLRYARDEAEGDKGLGEHLKDMPPIDKIPSKSLGRKKSSKKREVS